MTQGRVGSPHTPHQDDSAIERTLFNRDLLVTGQPNFQRGQAFPNTTGLLPAIAQDSETGRVLMLAWMDENAWKETVETQRAVYFSRSRGKLWRKGETSGNTIAVHEVWADCDGDALIYLAEPRGPSCHTNRTTCFFRRLEATGEVNDDPVAHARSIQRPVRRCRISASRAPSAISASFT